MAISFHDVDTTYFSATERRSAAVEALKARRVPRRPGNAKAGCALLRAAFAGCGMLVLGAFAVSFVPF